MPHLLPGHVYRAFDAEGGLLYVGMSLHPMQRLYHHAHRSPWWPDAATITVERFPDREAALAAEGLAIQLERPLFNVAGRRTTHRTTGRQHAAPTRAVDPPSEEAKKWIRRLRQVTAERARAHKEHDVARQVRDEKIREAHAAGITPSQLAAFTGLSIQRLDQIRRGARL